MTNLEYCYEIEFTKINFIERKIRITHPKTILLGPPKSGKSFLIYDYLSNFKAQEYLYIDFNDMRNDFHEIINNLEEFVYRNKIKVLVLENFDFDIKLPYCESIIITCKHNKEIKGFKKLFLMPLDFEEYLLHEKKNQNITHNFNNFLKLGNLPQTVNLNELSVQKELQNIIKQTASDNTSEEILKILFLNIDEKKSLNQLYLSLKSKIKISKDKFYEECKKYEKENIIFFIPKYNQEKAVKKIYSYNSAFTNAISYKKRFKNELTNIIFQELINKYDEIFYLDYIEFFIPSKKIAIASIPFFNSKLMQTQYRKIKKQLDENQIDELYIITVSNEEHIIYKNCHIYVIPFYEWSLG